MSMLSKSLTWTSAVIKFYQNMRKSMSFSALIKDHYASFFIVPDVKNKMINEV